MNLNLTEWAIRHRSLVIYFMLVIVVAGVGSYLRLGRSDLLDARARVCKSSADVHPERAVDDVDGRRHGRRVARGRRAGRADALRRPRRANAAPVPASRRRARGGCWACHS